MAGKNLPYLCHHKYINHAFQTLGAGLKILDIFPIFFSDSNLLPKKRALFCHKPIGVVWVHHMTTSLTFFGHTYTHNTTYITFTQSNKTVLFHTTKMMKQIILISNHSQLFGIKTFWINLGIIIVFIVLFVI